MHRDMQNCTDPDVQTQPEERAEKDRDRTERIIT